MVQESNHDQEPIGLETRIIHDIEMLHHCHVTGKIFQIQIHRALTDVCDSFEFALEYAQHVGMRTDSGSIRMPHDSCS